MTCPTPPKSRPVLRQLFLRPWSAAARRSPGLRRWLDRHGYITPHFSWRSYACTDGTPVPTALHRNAIRLHWRLELFRRRLGGVAITVNGPYRTQARNREVGGAQFSRHVQADAADIYVDQVDDWVRRSRRLSSRADVVRIAERTFKGVGNETSGTLHVDQRPGPRVRFVSWRAGR